MPCPCRAVSRSFTYAVFRQRRVLRESPRGSLKNPNSESDSLTDRLLLPLFTVVRMDSCEGGAIFACGVYLLREKGKRVKRTYWIHNVFRAREEEEEFHTLSI
jgi:hypothetical protein